MGAEEGEAESIALPVEELNKHGGGIDGKGKFIGMVNITVVLRWEEHGTALVDENLTTEVGFLLELLYVEAVGAPIKMPVDVLGTLTVVVLAVVGELNREAVKRTFMPAGDESFNYLAGKKVQRFVARNVLRGEHLIFR